MNKFILKREKLTKKYLMQLPENTFLSSNVADHAGCPLFAETVGAVSSRDEQWKRIVQANANGRLGNVFRNKADYARWHDSFSNAPGAEWRAEDGDVATP